MLAGGPYPILVLSCQILLPSVLFTSFGLINVLCTWVKQCWLTTKCWRSFEGEWWQCAECCSYMKSHTCTTRCAWAAAALQVDWDDLLPLTPVKQNTFFILAHKSIPLWVSPHKRTSSVTDSREKNEAHQLGAVVLTQQRGDTSDAPYWVHWPELSAAPVLTCPFSLNDVDSTFFSSVLPLKLKTLYCLSWPIPLCPAQKRGCLCF